LQAAAASAFVSNARGFKWEIMSGLKVLLKVAALVVRSFNLSLAVLHAILSQHSTSTLPPLSGLLAQSAL